jgi:hypothetical protein
VSDAGQRWATFLGKVRARLGEILDEAHAGLDELVQTEVIDPGPVSSAEQEVKARLFALRDKIEPAFAKLAAELGDEADAAEAQGRALGSEVLRAVEALEVRTRKQVLARLKVLADEERQTRRLQCTKCHGPLSEPAVQHRTDNVTCAHCGAVNTVRPGMATAMLHALAPKR